MRVNCNISAIIANNQLGGTENLLSQSIERLSSGLRINHASDDASGMAVTKKMHTQLKALERAGNNTTDGVAVVQTAEASLGEMENILQRMRELSVQAASDTNTLTDRAALQSEIATLSKEVDRIASDTEYNTMPLLDGTLKRRAFPSATVDGLEMNSMSTSVQSGQYAFTVTRSAQCARVTLDLNEMRYQRGGVNINGAAIELTGGDSEDDVYNKIADACNSAGLLYRRAGDSVYITEQSAGSKNSIEVTVSESLYNQSVVPGYIFDADHTTMKSYGVDAELNLGAGFAQTASYTADGNWITVRDVNSFEMRFEIPVGETFSASFNVTDIGTMNIQVGANEGQQIAIDIPETNIHTLGLDHLNVSTDHYASQAISLLDTAIDRVSAIRSKLGAYQNRLETTEKNLATYEENLTSALSGIEDCDMAEEMTVFTTENVKTQAATAVLAQANERPQTVLQLLQ